ncbi:MAG: BMP family ABC transporter substrate-binding protein [Polyangiaceae bacterium]|nr:BMP family ABC transporter substrate-binding protein [Polyangiaceae bacterium]
MSQRNLFSTLLLTAGFVLSSCSLVVNSSIGAGVGAPCEIAADCQGEGALCDETATCTLPCSETAACPSGSTCSAGFCRSAGLGELGDKCALASDCATADCRDGICVSPCSTTPDCPGGSTCINETCQVTMVAGFIFDNQVSTATEGFALSHEVGRKAAVEALPWLETVRSESNTTDTVNASIDGLIDEGAQVLVVTTNRFAAESTEKAAANPDVQFLNFATASSGENLTGYNVRYHQAWYVAGYVAGRFEDGGKIGFLGAVPNPQVIRQLNAFTLGALKANPSARVEVVWANNFVPDNAIAQKLVDYLVTGGNRIIVNRLGKGTAVSYVSQLASAGADLFSMGLDNDTACGLGPTSCLGAPYYNWGPLYTRMFDEIHRHVFDPKASINEPIRVDPAASPFHFALNDSIAGLSGLKPDIVTTISNLVGPANEDLTFSDGFCVTDPAQRPDKPECEASGYTIEDSELASMCWLVKGVVQPSDPEDPASALVDARAPDGTVIWPPKSVDPNSLTKPSCM